MAGSHGGLAWRARMAGTPASAVAPQCPPQGLAGYSLYGVAVGASLGGVALGALIVLLSHRVASGRRQVKPPRHACGRHAHVTATFPDSSSCSASAPRPTDKPEPQGSWDGARRAAPAGEQRLDRREGQVGNRPPVQVGPPCPRGRHLDSRCLRAAANHGAVTESATAGVKSVSEGGFVLHACCSFRAANSSKSGQGAGR